MDFIMAGKGNRFTPDGHDRAVCSRQIYKNAVDVHVTTFPGGTGMNEERHKGTSHVFYMLEGELSVLQHGILQKKIYAGDAVYIAAGEIHEMRNETKEDAVFLAVTFPE